MAESEYEPLFTPARTSEDDLEPVRDHFHRASRPFLCNPWSWFTWAVFLPAGAFATPLAFRINGPAAVLFLWSAVILIGGSVEIIGIRRAGGGFGSGASTLASWVLSVQGNISVVALLLSVLLVWGDMAWSLPGLWLLLLGHSFYMLGGLAFPPFRTCGLIYQVGGLAALWPGGLPLLAFALATAAGNLWMGISIWRERGD